MVVPFIGLVFLIAAMFPVGEFVWPVARGLIFGSHVRETSPLVLHAMFLLLTYLPASIVAWWFLSASRLRDRLPTPFPGSSLVFTGVVLTMLYLGARVLAAAVEGGGGSYVVASFAPYVVWPARALLAVGVVKLLLAAVPSNLSIDTDPQQQEAASPQSVVVRSS
jgi:hypothetical protein